MELYTETERLVIRPFRKDDYHNWLAQYEQRLPSQYSYDEGYKDMSLYSEERFSQWIDKLNESAQKDEMYNLGVFRKVDGVNVGKVELIKILRMDYQWAMMGYSLHNQYWKQGYAIESVLAARKLFFSVLGFQRIELHINVDNAPSIKLAEKAGFVFECVRKNFTFEDNEWKDFLIYYKNN